MGYAYEDEDVENIGDGLEEIPKLKKKKGKNKTYNVDNLLESEGNFEGGNKEYTVANLLESEEDTELYLNELITKNDQKLIDAYLGTNIKKITEKRFNFAAFFFGGAYLIYRKVYGIGAFWLILCLVVQVIFPIALIKWYITALFQIGASIMCGMLANQLILNNAAAKMLNLKLNKEKNIKEKMASIGGTNVILFIVALVIDFGVLSVYPYQQIEDMFKKLKYQTTYLRYEGIINAREDISIVNYIDITMPDGYKDSFYEPYRYSYFYQNDLNVSIELVMVSKYQSCKSLIQDVAIYENMSEDDVKIMGINGTTWYTVSSELSFYASSLIDGNMYFFRHVHRGNEEAFVDYEELLGSIKVK